MKAENSSQLRTMHDTVNECVMAIQNMKIKVDGWDPLLVHILLHKLDKETLKHYEYQLKDVKEPQKLCDFLVFIETRSMAMQSAENKSSGLHGMTLISSPIILMQTMQIIQITMRIRKRAMKGNVYFAMTIIIWVNVNNLLQKTAGVL